MSVLTRMIARLLLLPTLAIAVAVLVKGYADVGDGFSAGVIAALAVLMQYLAFGRRVVERILPVHLAPAFGIAGLLIALLVIFWPALLGLPIVTHVPTPEQEVIKLGHLELHTAVLFDIGVFMLVLGFTLTTTDMLARARDWSP